MAMVKEAISVSSVANLWVYCVESAIHKLLRIFVHAKLYWKVVEIKISVCSGE